MLKYVKGAALISVLVGAIYLAYTSYTNYNDDKSIVVDEALPKETILHEDVMKDGVIAKSDVKPEGYGVERGLTGALKSHDVNSLGNIDFSDAEAESFQIIGQFAEEKEMIESYVKKENKQYTSIIDWTYGNITPDEYKSLIVLCGQIYEDELNKNESGRYTVEAKIPESEALEKIGVQLLFAADESNMLTLWTDLIVRDSTDKVEVEELKSFTLYYEGNVIKIK